MKTIEEIREKARKILKSPMEIDDKINAFLSIVIGEVEEKVYCSHNEPRKGDIYECRCDGTGKIKHPITVKDAIEGRGKCQ